MWAHLGTPWKVKVSAYQWKVKVLALLRKPENVNVLDHPESEGRTWTGFKWNALKIPRHLKEVRSRWSWTRRWVREEHGKPWELGTLLMRAIFIGNRVGSPVLESTGWVSYQRPFLHVIESFQVMFMNTSFTQHVVVLTTLDEHHHEEEPGFTTKDNYHWTQEQEKVPHIWT